LLIQRETVTCPCCWESIEITLDLSGGDQQYVEDCSVCCRPLVITIRTDGEDVSAIQVTAENGE
jgi:cysteine-rich CPXCG protein